MNADKRSPHTDALETLGTLHQYDEKRDAIHIAVIQVTAGEYLEPGNHVYLKGDIPKVYQCEAKNPDAIGIVDPFITDYIDRNARFWLVLYPRTIQSLRHVWSHPSFEDNKEFHDPQIVNFGAVTDIDAVAKADPAVEQALLLVGDPMATARKRVADYASDVDVTVDWLMNSFDGGEHKYHPDGSEHGESMEGPSDAVKDAVALLKGVPSTQLKRWRFTCSC